MLLSTEPTDDQINELWSELRAFNTSQLGPIDYTPILLRTQNDSGELTGGLIGKIFYQWLYVDLLWVSEESRITGLGSLLLKTAEDHARKLGCRQAWLDTFTFQAPEFYRKQGYEVFGELTDYPHGHRRLFLRKTLV